MDTDSVIVFIKTDNVYKALQRKLKQDLILLIVMNQKDHYLKETKVIGLIKDELAGKTMIESIGFKAKTYSFLINDGSEDKKAKSTKKCDKNRKIKFESYKNCL